MLAPKPYKRPGLISFYRRKVVAFLAVSCLMVFVGLRIHANSFSADESPLLDTSMGASNTTFTVVVAQDGAITINGQESKKQVAIHADFDEVRLPVVDNPGRSYDLLQIILTLPSGVAYDTKNQILAIHGVGQSRSYVKDNRTIIYEVANVSPYATVSIVAEMPKGTVRPPIINILSNYVSQIKLNVWILVAITMPLLSFLFTVAFVFYELRRQKIEVPDREIDSPPMALPPAVLGVLIHQRVRAREVAATLVDLSARGNITIIEHDRGFVFGKGIRFDQNVINYEKLILDKIFSTRTLSSDQAEISERVNSHLYSKKMSLASEGIYGLTTQLGYFKTNPRKIHAKYRLTGLFFLLVGLVGFFASLRYFTEPPYIVFFWVGMMISAIIIMAMASFMPIRTVLGQEVMSNWLAFKAFLSNPDPIPFSVNMGSIFERYLPYAIVFDCEVAWAKRFINHPFMVPKWFVTNRPNLDMEEFCLALFPIISYVSRSLIMLREPGFE